MQRFWNWMINSDKWNQVVTSQYSSVYHQSIVQSGILISSILSLIVVGLSIYLFGVIGLFPAAILSPLSFIGFQKYYTAP